MLSGSRCDLDMIAIDLHSEDLARRRISAHSWPPAGRGLRRPATISLLAPGRLKNGRRGDLSKSFASTQKMNNALISPIVVAVR